MDVSILIVNYHSADLVIDCIRSVKEKTTCTYEIIVVDNASGDGSVEKLQATFGDTITVIASPENLGFGKANNLAAAHATGEYVLLLNPDTLLVNQAIDVLVDYLKLHKDVGVAGGNLVFPDLKPAPSFCLKFDELKEEKKRSRYVSILGGRFFKPKTLPEYNDTDAPMEVAYIFGADMMMPRRVFEEVGGFDPDFFMYGEEEELTWRIKQKGYRVMCVPDATIIHLEGATINKEHGFNERQFRMRMNGTMTYYLKRFGKDGVKAFYRWRSRRYDRLLWFAKRKGTLTADHVVAIQRRLLEEEYQAFLKDI